MSGADVAFPVERPLFFVVSGSPGAGKTTLLAELRARGHAVVAEAARSVIRLQSTVGGRAVPWKDPFLFTEVEFAQSLHNFASQDPSSLTFFDRSFVDSCGGLQLLEAEVPRHFSTAVAQFRFAPTVVLAPPWREIYRRDRERRQTFDEAERVYHVLDRTYRHAGYEVFELPKASTSERADVVMDLVAGSLHHRGSAARDPR